MGFMFIQFLFCSIYIYIHTHLHHFFPPQKSPSLGDPPQKKPDEPSLQRGPADEPMVGIPNRGLGLAGGPEVVKVVGVGGGLGLVVGMECFCAMTCKL